VTRWIKPGPDFANLFATFERSAWRLETRPAYAIPEEQAAFERHRITGELDVAYLAGWLETVKTATEAGKRFERVRVLPEPLTDYLRFEMAVAEHNTEAGEDIRTLTARKARALELPDLHDFWIFDDQRVAILHFSPDGELLNAELHDDPDTLTQYSAWKELAWRHADPALTH
jgi:hypothetical protein